MSVFAGALLDLRGAAVLSFAAADMESIPAEEGGEEHVAAFQLALGASLEVRGVVRSEGRALFQVEAAAVSGSQPVPVQNFGSILLSTGSAVPAVNASASGLLLQVCCPHNGSCSELSPGDLSAQLVNQFGASVNLTARSSLPANSSSSSINNISATVLGKGAILWNFGFLYAHAESEDGVAVLRSDAHSLLRSWADIRVGPGLQLGLGELRLEASSALHFQLAAAAEVGSVCCAPAGSNQGFGSVRRHSVPSQADTQ